MKTCISVGMITFVVCSYSQNLDRYLLTSVCLQAKAKRPGTVLVMRFGGLSDESLNSRKCLRSVCRQLRRVFGEGEDDVPFDAVGLRLTLEKCMTHASSGESVNLILDGVDDLETPRGYEPGFDWLPRKLPDFSSLIISIRTVSTAHISALNAIFTGEVYYRVWALKAPQGNAAIDKWLDATSRQGTALAHFEHIRDQSPNSAGLEGTPLNCSPIFVEYAVDLSKNWLSYNDPPKLPGTISELIDWMMGDLEKRHGRVLVERCMGFLILSRDGLTLQELGDVLSCDDDTLDEVNQR